MMIFDSHLHIIDPAFPLVANQGYLPESYSSGDYRDGTRPLGIVGGAIVSASFQGFDQSYLLAALDALGPNFVGVTQLRPEVSDEEILRLNAAGVRAIRFNVRRGGSADISQLPTLARRVHALAGWHAELYIDGGELPDLLRTLLGLPRVVIDHLGLSRAGLTCIYKLVERGVQVKASGFGRLDFDPVPVVREIASINPYALLFGTDLPSTRAPRAFEAADIHRLRDALDAAVAENALYNNAVRLYRPRGLAPH
ncbi:MAG: 4-sulfomuconolactone hydrolase [Gammaproteobacteria bacterium]|nr:4-sulfomuconolactone hydrolase [Gammaproteobacteria bacterium]